MKIYKDVIQGSEEWLALRKGRPTASRFSDIITAETGALSKSSTGYIHELIGECFVPDFKYWDGNYATERGKEMEPIARDAFATHTGLKIEQVGFCVSNDGISGCSPDALILGADGEHSSGVEIKCPTPKVHVSYVLGGVLPSQYKQQVHGSMAVTGLSEWHFWSFFPGMMHFHIVVKRDAYTEKLQESLSAFVKSYREASAIAIPKLKVSSQ